jgi:SagB-type dehydrogenase family enzyme
MSEARTPADLAVIAALPPAATLSCLSLLLSAKVIDQARDGVLPEEDDDTLRQWEFHDLAFHARSRLGRHDHGIGGTFRFFGKLPSLPAVRSVYPGAAIALAKPASNDAGINDRSLAAVMSARRSVRRHGNTPISVGELGVFLFRVARVERVIPADPALGRRYETSMRPYPSGGATYDLEIYLTVHQCTGLDPALYHYDPLVHALRLVAPQGPTTDALLDGARFAAKMQDRPQIVVTLTSRFQRLSWKYESIAYAATLKNVGVLYETMYLVATAMELAPCALGAGNSDLFSRLIGTDYYRESSVGEFMLGSR